MNKSPPKKRVNCYIARDQTPTTGSSRDRKYHNTSVVGHQLMLGHCRVKKMFTTYSYPVHVLENKTK